MANLRREFREFLEREGIMEFVERVMADAFERFCARRDAQMNWTVSHGLEILYFSHILFCKKY